MFKRFFLVLSAFFVCAGPVFASVTITLDAGLLTTQNGVTTLPVNSLLLLIVDPASTTDGGGIFPDASPGAFVGGNNIVIAEAAMNNNGGSSFSTPYNGETIDTLGFDYSSGDFAIGDKIALRWFSGYFDTGANYVGYTSADHPAVPLATGETYGTYSTTSAYTTNTNDPDGGTNWVAPTDGTYTDDGLNFFTTDDPQGGTQTPSEGQADTAITALAVPEPSTFALLGAGLLVIAGGSLRKRQGSRRE